jgi:hypothetical protein
MLFAHLFAAPAPAPAPAPGVERRRNKAVEVEAYKCPACDALHEDEFDAEDCCPYDGDVTENLLHDQEGDEKCPVCGEGCADAYLAADCCLWKDLPPAARWRIAAAVEGGAEWRDAIAKETGHA